MFKDDERTCPRCGKRFTKEPEDAGKRKAASDYCSVLCFAEDRFGADRPDD